MKDRLWFILGYHFTLLKIGFIFRGSCLGLLYSQWIITPTSGHSLPHKTNQSSFPYHNLSWGSLISYLILSQMPWFLFSTMLKANKVYLINTFVWMSFCYSSSLINKHKCHFRFFHFNRETELPLSKMRLEIPIGLTIWSKINSVYFGASRNSERISLF